MRRIWSAVGLLGLRWLVLVAFPKIRVESAGDPLPLTTPLPACYADVFKTAHTKLTAVYGTPEQEATDNHICDFSADGKLALSTNNGNIFSDQVEDTIITLWDVENGKRLRQIHLKKSYVSGLQMTPDGKRAFGALWLGGQGDSEEEVKRDLVVWDLNTGKELKRWSDPERSFSGLALAPDGKRGLTHANRKREPIDPSGSDQRSNDQSGPVHVWDLETGKKLLSFSANLSGLTVSRNGKFAAFAVSDEKDTRIQLWDLTTGKKVRTWEEKVETYTLKFSEDGKQLAAILDETVKIWDTDTGKVIATVAEVEPSFPWPNLLAFSQDGKQLALVHNRINSKKLEPIAPVSSPLGFDHLGKDDDEQPDQSVVTLWELPAAKKLWSKPLTLSASFLTFSADQQQVLVCGAGKSFVLLDAANGKELRGRGGDHDAPVNGVVTSPDGKFLYTAGEDRTIQRWNAVTGRQEHTFQAHAKEVTCLALSTDGQRLLSGSADQTVKLWNAATGQLLRTFNGHTERVTSVAWSRDGKLALSGGIDCTARLWDVATGKQLRLLQGHADGVLGVALSADGSLAITASADSTLKIWDLDAEAGDRKPQVLKGHKGGASCVHLSADGRYLLSGSRDKTVKLWDVDTGKEVKTFRGYKNWVSSVRFSPNGKLGVSVSDDLTVKLWDLSSGKQIDQLDLGKGSDCGRCLAFAPDGRSFFLGTLN